MYIVFYDPRWEHCVSFVNLVQVIAGIETAVRSMKVGGIRRVIIPPSQGYQNMDQEPIPPNVSSPKITEISLLFNSGWNSFIYSFSTDKGCLQPFSILHGLQMEKGLPWGLSYSTSNWSAWSTSNLFFFFFFWILCMVWRNIYYVSIRYCAYQTSV